MTISSEYLGLAAVASFVMAAASLVVTPWMLVKMPADYFAEDAVPHGPQHPVLRALKNVLGVVLVLAGVLMLVLPGQGLLTIVIGLMLVDFPGKKKLERRLVARPKVRQAIDWLRRKYDREPLRF